MTTAGITLEQAQAQLSAWLDASIQLATSQSYEINTGNGSRSLTRADAGEVRRNVEYWRQMVQGLAPVGSGGRRRIVYPVKS